MELATVFKLSIYILTGAVGLALGIAEQGPIAFVSVPLTIFAYWWCEVRTQAGGISRGVGENTAAGLGFLALFTSTVEFFSESQEAKLLSGIHLVVYLTWIVLLQKKSSYRYWLLMALGIMHVAVGSVLTNATWYGMFMVAYLFGAIWTLSVFSLYRLSQEFAAAETATASQKLSHLETRGRAFNTIRFEDHADWISVRLIVGVFLTSLTGLVVGILFFMLIPRVWAGSALGITDDSLPATMRKNITGLATEIRLGDMGPILESNDPVLALKVFDNQTGARLEVQSIAESLGMREPLFRAAILIDYLGGRWRPERGANEIAHPLPPAPDDQYIQHVVPTARQEYLLHRIGTDILPCLGRPLAVCDGDGYRCGRLQTSNALVVRREKFKTIPGVFNYVAFTPLEPIAQSREAGLAAGPFNSYIQRCLDVPEGLSRLREFSRQLLDAEQKAAGKALSDIQKARLMEAHLRDSGQYVYSLDAATVDAKSDPVEDFLFRRQAGHCQYFASALAMMLRSVDVPARLVTGFKGGEPLPDGTLNVEKRFAHVWVEAWVENRRWLTLDATPEDGRAESVNAIGTRRSIWSAMGARLAGIWEANVLDISYERQDSYFYEPLRERLSTFVQFLREFWQSPQTSMMSMIGFIIDPRNWLSIRGAVILTGLVGLLILIRRKTNLFHRFWKKRSGGIAEKEKVSVEFYERFVRLMQQRGHQRKLTQTQAEFVDEMAGEVAVARGDASVAARLPAIADLFYRVRFGDGDLTHQDQSLLNDLLANLEQSTAALPPASAT